MFEGFALEYIDVGEVTLRVRHGGQGRPGGAAAWPPPYAYDLVPAGTAASGLLLRRLPGLARLRPIDAASRCAPACSILQKGHGWGCGLPYAAPRPRAVRRSRPRPRVIGRFSHGYGSPQRGHAAGRDGRPPGDRAPRAPQRTVRAYLVALVVPRPDGQARPSGSSTPIRTPGTGHLFQPRWERPTTPTCGQLCAIPPSSTACARTTGLASASIAPTRKLTARLAAGSPARRCC